MGTRLRLHRRTVLGWLSASGIVTGCVADPSVEARDPQLPDREDVDWPDAPAEPVDNVNDAAVQNVRALMDVFIPTERDSNADIVAAGALEAGAMEMLELSRFLPSARALALIPQNATPGFEDLETFDAALRGLLSADLDGLAFRQHPLTPFRNLERHEQEAVVRDAMDDPLTRPLLVFARAAAFIAFLGATHNDLGLIYAGFPPFEDFDGGIANRGYPRTADGRVVDVDTEDLAELAARGELEDYTYNLEPPPTPDDDLSDILDANGDLV